MAAASTTNRSPPPPALVVPPILSTGGSERTSGVQVKSASFSGMAADVGSRNTSTPAENRSLAREPYRIRIDAQNNGFSSERERLILMRSISHLRKDETITNQQQKTTLVTQSQVPDGEDNEHSVRPFHHSELASPPCYSNTRSGFSRLSLDVRRSRAMSASDSTPYGEQPQSGSGTLNERRWFSRSQFDLSTPTPGLRESGDNSPTSQRFTPQGGSLTDGVLQAKARVAAMASAKLRRFSFANLPKMNSKKSGNIVVNKELHQPSIEKGKQKAMPIEQFSVTEAQNRGTRIATHYGNSDDSISALESAESGVRFARPNQHTVRRNSDAPSSFNSTEPSTSSEGEASSMQSRQNSDLRHSITQSTSANDHSPQIFTTLDHNDDHEVQEDDGIQWATPSESVHNFINPFDRKNQTTKPEYGSASSPTSPTFNKRQSSLPLQSTIIEEISENGPQQDHNATKVITLTNSEEAGEMSTTHFISPFASFLPSRAQVKIANALGIDEEQAYLERAKEENDAEGGANSNENIPILDSRQSSNNNMYSTQTSQSQHQDSTNNGQPRRNRSSRLSQLPRLNSARGKQAFSGGNSGQNRQAGGGIGGGSGDGSDDGDDRRDSNASQISEDPPSDDETIEGQEEGETETDSDSDASLVSDDDLSGMPGSLPAPNSHGQRMARGMSTGSRGRRPSGIAMPPAPTFAHLEPFTNASGQNHLEGVGKPHANIGPTDTEVTEELIDGITTPKIGKRSGYENDSLNSTITERTPSASMGPIRSRENWTQFGEETPGWLPTPRASAPAGSSMQSPKSGLSIQTQSKNGQGAGPMDTSYFNIQPAPANNVIRNRNDTSNPNIPPPSPSIITRARAQSSASLRSIGLSPGISTRELPPMPPIVPLNLRSADRALSPNRKIVSPTPVLATPSLSTFPDESSTDSTNEATELALASQEKQTSSRTTTPRPNNATSLKSAQGPALPVSSPSSPRNAELLLHSSHGRKAGAALLGVSDSGTGRPGLYKQESRSLIDLNSPKRNQIEPSLKPLHKPVSVRDIRSTQVDQLKQTEQQARTASPAPSVESITAPTSASASTTNLRRRNSMYEVGAAPPPYTIIPGGGNGIEAKIVPREEEGKESLPHYHCSVHIEGYLPRKMEFSSPGVQAKDRSWKRQYFILHGTCLRIYRTDLSGERSALKGEHGVMSGVHVHHDPMNEDGPNQPVGTTTSKVIATDGNTNVNSKEQQQHNPTTASTGNGQNQSVNRSPTASTINSKLSDGHSGNGALSRKVEALSGTISHSLHRGSLVKQYTLQGAESGLAADYLKRRHVVRVRAEGEQFLLQTRNDRHVVDWIEAFQAATNIAMDLERRPMPKFITLPRRRRRRNGQRTRDASGNDTNGRSINGGAEQEASVIPDGDLSARELADIAEARRRSLMESSLSTSQRSSVSGQSRANPPRPLGLPGDESPNPSAAFERMLREEEEAMARQDAGDI